jgi:putative glutathione S-transferase
MTLGMLVEGKWVKNWTERDARGRFNRMPTQFCNWITADGSSGFKAGLGAIISTFLWVALGRVAQ